MQILNTKDSDFNIEFNELLNRGNMDIESVSNVVKDILNDIKANGDSAILSHIARFDHWNPSSFDDIMVDKNLLQQAYNGLSKELKNALKTAFDRITAFHMKQKSKSWIDFEDNGTMLGVKITPINRAGLYIPGGKAAYPSSLLMNAIPAIVAGVKEIIVCTPTPNNEPSKLLLAAAHIWGLDSVYKVGGASAIGLMAYGSENLKKVDVITGPGNIYVATAKKLVFGDVNIDMIAGPSEIGIIADKNANPTYIALDLLSQAEHDEMASSILITNDNDLAHKVRNEIEIELKKLNRYEIASKSINNRACIIISNSLQESIQLMNCIAPEHLEILCENPHSILPFIDNAGAIFLGENTPEPIGDYIAGPNHTLPTGGSSRFFSPLSVDNFIKKSSIISFSKEAILSLGNDCCILAQSEGLEAHMKSVKVRLGDK